MSEFTPNELGFFVWLCFVIGIFSIGLMLMAAVGWAMDWLDENFFQ